MQINFKGELTQIVNGVNVKFISSGHGEIEIEIDGFKVNTKENDPCRMNWLADVIDVQKDNLLNPLPANKGDRYALNNPHTAHKNFGDLSNYNGPIVVEFDGEKFNVVFTAETTFVWNRKKNELLSTEQVGWKKKKLGSYEYLEGQQEIHLVDED